MDRQAEQLTEALRSWVESYGDVIRLVWERFAATGEWPEAARLTRERFGIQPRSDFTEIARNMPPQLGRLDLGGAGPHRIVLTARGLYYVPAARSVLDAFARLVQIGVQRYANFEGEAVIGAAELQGLLDLEEPVARQVEELVVQDQWFFRLAGGTPESGDLRIAVDERAVFFAAEVQTIEDYLDAQLNAWYPETPALPQPDLAQAGAEVTPGQERDPRRVMVVHGRDLQARNDLFALLRALGLRPIEWTQAVRATGSGTPYTGEAVEAAFGIAQAAVVLFTPDEEVVLREDLRNPGDPADAGPGWQARPNVYFEGGIAFTSHPTQTIVLELGPVRVASDLLGRNVIRIDGGARWRHEFAERLRNTDCPVDTSGSDWLEAGEFRLPDLAAIGLHAARGDLGQTGTARGRPGGLSAGDPVAQQAARLDEMILDGTRVLSDDTGTFMENGHKWVIASTDDLRDLTDEVEPALFEQSGRGARDHRGHPDPKAELLEKVNYLRDKVKLKLQEGTWSNSLFCQRERELLRRPQDGDVAMFVIDRIRSGDTLRRRIRSTQPPNDAELDAWASDTRKGFWDRGVGTYGDQFARRSDGLDDDEVEEPGDWAAQSAFVDRRLEALRRVLGDVRGQS